LAAILVEALVAISIAVLAGASVGNWVAELVGELVVKPEGVPVGRAEVQAWVAERGH
jgi:hypothetical protein